MKIEERCRSKKGGASGEALGKILIAVWLFFFLKYSVGLISYKINLKDYDVVTATVTDSTVKKEVRYDEDTRHSYTVNNYTSYYSYYYGGHYYTGTYKPNKKESIGSQVKIYVNPSYPESFIKEGKESDYIEPLIVAMLFPLAALLFGIPQMRQIMTEKIVLNKRREYIYNQGDGIGTIDMDKQYNYDVNVQQIPTFETEYDKSGETFYINQNKQ